MSKKINKDIKHFISIMLPLIIVKSFACKPLYFFDVIISSSL